MADLRGLEILRSLPRIKKLRVIDKLPRGGRIIQDAERFLRHRSRPRQARQGENKVFHPLSDRGIPSSKQHKCKGTQTAIKNKIAPSKFSEGRI